jgi:hypothetical protein
MTKRSRGDWRMGGGKGGRRRKSRCRRRKSRNNDEYKRNKEIKDVAFCIVYSDALFRKANIVFFLMA